MINEIEDYQYKLERYHYWTNGSLSDADRVYFAPKPEIYNFKKMLYKIEVWPTNLNLINKRRESALFDDYDVFKKDDNEYW